MTDKSAARAASAAGSAPGAPVAGVPPREIEIKFRADKAAVEALLKSHLLRGVPVSPAREVHSVYFDTPEKDLHRHGLSLRVRRKGRAGPVLGVKWEGEAAEGPFSRGEAEVACPGGEPSLQLFDPALNESLAKIAGEQPLQPVFETRVKRRVAVIRHRHSEVELSLDDGFIVAGEQRLAVAEAELELKSGNLHDLLDCAAALAEEGTLPLEFEAKSDRGYRLAGGEAPRPQKAQPVELRQEVTFDDLAGLIISATLNHFVANWAALRESDGPEAVHQLRVALRRMRSALGLFRRVIRLPELEDIRREAKRIASALGPARECDAFRQNALAGPLRGDAGGLKGAASLLDAVEARRQQGYAEARRILEEGATTRFVLRVQSFVEGRAWRSALAPDDLGLLTSRGRTFAAEALDRLLRRALKRGRKLRTMPDEQRHELRIALKNLRYAVEFFGSLFPAEREQKHFLKLVAELQEDLGVHNDAATAQSFLDGLGLPPDAETHFASGFLLGWYRHATTVADAHLVKKWKQFKSADPFWE